MGFRRVERIPRVIEAEQRFQVCGVGPMRLSDYQVADILAVREILATVLRGDSPVETVAERLEDAAKLILDVSESVSLDIWASRTPSPPPT